VCNFRHHAGSTNRDNLVENSRLAAPTTFPGYRQMYDSPENKAVADIIAERPGLDFGS